MDRDTLIRAYDRSAETYDPQFRLLQRAKYRAAASLLIRFPPPAGGVLDAGGGTALFAEWLSDLTEPLPGIRAELRQRRLVVLDASLGMLRLARPRAPLCIAADLALPPLRANSFALVLAFTSILGEPLGALRALASLLGPGGVLLATFLAPEATAAEEAFPVAGLREMTDSVEAGQDRAFLLRRH